MEREGGTLGEKVLSQSFFSAIFFCHLVTTAPPSYPTVPRACRKLVTTALNEIPRFLP